MSTADPLARARSLTRLLDTAARIPGTGIRFGLDPVLGLVPGLGDLAGAALAGYLVLVGARLGVSRTVIFRMLANVAVDTVGGTLPIVGDAFDVAWKSNSRNLALLERTLGRTDVVGWRDAAPAGRAVVGTALVGLALVAAAGIFVAVLVVRFLAHHIG